MVDNTANSKTNSAVNPRIYVADLAAYVAGKYHGTWIDATQSADDILAEIKEMLKDSPEPIAEEWALHDYEDFFDAGSILGEYPDLEDVATAASLIEEYGEVAGQIIGYYGEVEEAQEALEERYIGVYKSVADYAEELIKDTENPSEFLSRYIDYEKVARDFEIGGDILAFKTAPKEYHLFDAQ